MSLATLLEKTVFLLSRDLQLDHASSASEVADVLQPILKLLKPLLKSSVEDGNVNVRVMSSLE